MENKSPKTEWQPNDTQKKFLEVLKDYPDGTTLLEVKMDTGISFATGSINVLKSKGLIKTDEDKRTYECDLVFQGAKIGTTKKAYTVYRLA